MIAQNELTKQEQEYVEAIAEIYARFPEWYTKNVVSDENFDPEADYGLLTIYSSYGFLMEAEWSFCEGDDRKGDYELNGGNLHSALNKLRCNTETPLDADLTPGYFALELNKVVAKLPNLMSAYIRFQCSENGEWGGGFDAYVLEGWEIHECCGLMNEESLSFIRSCASQGCFPEWGIGGNRKSRLSEVFSKTFSLHELKPHHSHVIRCLGQADLICNLGTSVSIEDLMSDHEPVTRIGDFLIWEEVDRLVLSVDRHSFTICTPNLSRVSTLIKEVVEHLDSENGVKQLTLV